MELSNSATKAFTAPALQAHFDGVTKKHKLEKKGKEITKAKVTEVGLTWLSDGKGHSQWLNPPLTVEVVAGNLLASGKVSRIAPIYKARAADGEEFTLLPNLTKREHGDSPALAAGDVVAVHGHLNGDGKPVFTYRKGAAS